MDYFDFQTISNTILKNKQKFLSCLEKLQFDEKTLQNSSDLLCQCLDYSPKISKSQKETFHKIKLKNNILFTEPESSITNANIQSQPPLKPTSPNEFIKRLLYDIINKSIATSSYQDAKNSSEDESDDEDDDDEEYERLMQRRLQEIEKKERGISQHAVNNKISISKITNIFGECIKINVYLFFSSAFIEIDINSNDTVYTLKQAVIAHILEKKTFDLNYPLPEAFEVRVIDDDNNKPDMDLLPLEDKLNIFHSKYTSLAFVDKKNYKPSTQAKQNKILGTVKGEEKLHLKIYFNKEIKGNTSKILAMKRDETIRDVMVYLSNRSLLKYKNIDLYYFIPHSDKFEDIDNAINMETPLVSLQSHELNLCFKKFPDVPDSNIKNDDMKDDNEDLKEDENGREYIFNDTSAGKYQEFEVVKVNKYKSKQERILGIDMYYIYNKKPKQKSHGLLKKIFKETKNPMKQIKDLQSCEIIGNRKLCIQMINLKKNEGVKKIIYEVKNNNVRNEIVAKLKFLIKLNKQ